MIVEELVSIPADEVTLQARLAYEEESNPEFIAVVAAPHPLLGGTIDNPVLLAIMRGVAEAGAMALTWEYRTARVKQTPGELAQAREAFWLDPAEAAGLPQDCADALRCIQWVRSQMPFTARAPVRFAGYSYGGALALLLAGEGERALAVSPPLGVLARAGRLHCHRMSIVLAENDLAISPDEWTRFQNDYSGQIEAAVTLGGEDHFLRHSIDIVQSIARNWATQSSVEICMSAP